jgi:hypothetical protein
MWKLSSRPMPIACEQLASLHRGKRPHERSAALHCVVSAPPARQGRFFVHVRTMRDDNTVKASNFGLNGNWIYFFASFVSSLDEIFT